jgi:hypothetical protein
VRKCTILEGRKAGHESVIFLTSNEDPGVKVKNPCNVKVTATIITVTTPPSDA